MKANSVKKYMWNREDMYTLYIKKHVTAITQRL